MTNPGSDSSAAPIVSLDAGQASDDVTVFVKDYETLGEIGLYAEEYGRKQRLRFSVDAGCHYGSLSKCQDQETIVCYKSMIDLIEAELDKGHVDLVETLADRLCTRILSDNRILWVTLSVEKLEAISKAQSVGIRVTRRQSRGPES